MPQPRRTTPSLFPDTPAGMLSKAQALTRMCPDKENWTCVMGFVDYKLAPSADDVKEEVLDEFMDWLHGLRLQLEETGACDEDLEGANAEQVGDLMRRVVEHLRGLQ